MPNIIFDVLYRYFNVLDLICPTAECSDSIGNLVEHLLDRHMQFIGQSVPGA